MRRVILITDCLAPPFDEGMKVFALELAKYLSSRFEFMALTNRHCDLPGIQSRTQRLGVSLNSRKLDKIIKEFSPDVIDSFIPKK